MDPGGVWWSRDIFRRGPVVSFVQGVNTEGHYGGKGRLLEVVLTHEVGGGVSVRGKTRGSALIVSHTRDGDVRYLTS